MKKLINEKFLTEKNIYINGQNWFKKQCTMNCSAYIDPF